MNAPTTAVVALCLSLSACGFQLRGAVTIDPGLSPMGVEAARAGSPLLPPLRRALADGGVELAKPGSQVASLLRIHAEETGERVIVVTAQGRPREVELFHLVEFELVGPEGVLIERRTVVRTREYAVDERDILGKIHEASALRDALRRDMVTALVRRVAAARPLTR